MTDLPLPALAKSPAIGDGRGLSPAIFAAPYQPAGANTARLVALSVVLSVHAGALGFWLMKPEPAQVLASEMQVAVEIVAPSPAPAAAPTPVPEPVKTPPPKKTAPPAPVAERAIIPLAATPTPPSPATVAAPVPTQAAAPVIVPSAPVIPDTEPDYKAAYLNNPTPPYPLSARRMGIQGRVVLNVEVLAEGSCGQALVQQSSGYAMLDNSALQTVRSWRFIPARQAGQSVTKWFRIPIQFTLKDNEA
ncbi:MAG: TonB family protein [Nitrosomonadales bacterium]|nr:TonB family protein [Nitrosomonadales bacterium]